MARYRLHNLVVETVVGVHLHERTRRQAIHIDVEFTANAMAGDREHYLASGFDDYVSKPFAPAELFDALARQMAGVSPMPDRRESAPGSTEDLADGEPAAAIQAR